MVNPRLSLCMIIRDEEKMLEQFLACADGLWDELCVVDTGSRDRSMELLRAAGARVQELPWTNDFSVARNASLAMARGEWIIFLDADEMIRPQLKHQIRKLLDDASVGAATLVMRNQMAHGHYHDSPLLRIFRNDPSIRFCFPIHEDIATSVNAYLARAGQRLVALPGVVDHLGYVRSVAAEKDKKNRDRQLLNDCLRQNPDDFYSHFKLLELAKFWNDGPMFRQAARQAKNRLEQGGEKALQGFDYIGELITLTAEGLYRQEPAEFLDFLLRWPQEHSAAYLLKRAEIYELQGELAKSQADFLACIRIGQDRLKQLVTVRPYMGLTRVAMAQGDFSAASGYAERGLDCNPRDPEALLAAIALRKHTGSAALAAFIAKYKQEHGDNFELHQALGEEAFVSGDFVTAARELAIAAEANPEDLPLQLRLAQAYLASGRLDASRQLCQQLLPDMPQAIAGLLLTNLLRGEDTQADVEIEPEVLDHEMRTWVTLLKNSHQPEIFSRFCLLIPAVEHLFPWLSELHS